MKFLRIRTGTYVHMAAHYSNLIMAQVCWCCHSFSQPHFNLVFMLLLSMRVQTDKIVTLTTVIQQFLSHLRYKLGTHILQYILLSNVLSVKTSYLVNCSQEVWLHSQESQFNSSDKKQPVSYTMTPQNRHSATQLEKFWEAKTWACFCRIYNSSDAKSERLFKCF